MVNLPSRSDGSDANAQLRGVGEQAWAVHDKAKIVQDRRFNAGLREIVVGKGAQSQFRGLPVAVMLVLLGGVLGGLVAWAIFNGYSVSMLGSNFSQVVFQFRPPLIRPSGTFSRTRKKGGACPIGHVLAAFSFSRLREKVPKGG